MIFSLYQSSKVQEKIACEHLCSEMKRSAFVRVCVCVKKRRENICRLAIVDGHIEIQFDSYRS